MRSKPTRRPIAPRSITKTRKYKNTKKSRTRTLIYLGCQRSAVNAAFWERTSCQKHSARHRLAEEDRPRPAVSSLQSTLGLSGSCRVPHGTRRAPEASPHWQGAGFGPAERSSVPVSPQPPIATRHEPGCYAKNLPLFLGLGCIFQPEDAERFRARLNRGRSRASAAFLRTLSSLDISGRNSLVRGLQLRGLCFLASNQVKPFKMPDGPGHLRLLRPEYLLLDADFSSPCNRALRNASANSLSAIASPCWAATRPSAVM